VTCENDAMIIYIVDVGMNRFVFAYVFFFLMIRRPPRSTLFPYRRSSDLYSQASLTVPAMHVYFFFVITHRSVLSILISNLINKYSSLTLAPNMPCMLLV